jgi:hypothetical protein
MISFGEQETKSIYIHERGREYVDAYIALPLRVAARIFERTRHAAVGPTS